MSCAIKQYFVPVESCIDYQSYIYKINPGLTQDQYEVSRRILTTLGTADEQRMGVVYVRGPWGFLVIPHFGYPTMRISFFHDTAEAEINEVLSLIYAAFENAQTTNNQGGLDG